MKSHKYIHRRPGRLLWRIVLACANVFAAIGLCWSAYGGVFSPETHPLGGIMGLTFPLWIITAVLLVVVDLITWPWSTLVPIAAMIGCVGPLLSFSPTGLRRYEPKPGEHIDTLDILSYNVMSMKVLDSVYPDDTNPTMSFVLAQKPDIAIMQECEVLTTPWNLIHLRQPQCDSVAATFPYRDTNPATAQAVASTLPIKRLRIKGNTDHRIIAYHLTLPDGDSVLLFNVHLQSIMLTRWDKALYHDITNLDARHGVRSHLLRKLVVANRRRAQEGELIRNAIDSLNYPNVIVSGDFNDVQDCHAIRLIEGPGHDMHQAWQEGARGPAITYHRNRFYFRIDHLLYRGRFRALDVHRGTYAGSDHYPLHVRLAVLPKHTAQ